MTTGPTSGPWQTSAKAVNSSQLHPDGSWYAILSGTGALVALVNDWDDIPEEAAANRALIKAAPDLVAALGGFMRVHRAFNNLLANRESDTAIVGTLDGLLDNAAADAEAAIEKAR